MICNGVCAVTTCAVLDTLRSHPSSPLRALSTWRIVTAFSGCDTFLACVRACGIKYTILASSDTDPTCRRVLSATPHRQAHRPDIHHDSRGEAAKTAPASDLTAWGFPCVTFSLLNHHTSDETISSTLQCYIDAFEYIRLRRPAVFLFENVANLLSCACLLYTSDAADE